MSDPLSCDQQLAVNGMDNCAVNSNDGDACNEHYTHAVDEGAAVIPTRETYSELQRVFDYLNWYLFENALPNCLITLQGHKGTYGYFEADRFGRKDGRRTDHIAINPRHLARRKIGESLSTLGHDMCHLKQHHDGKPGRGRYHNKEFARMMKAIGLVPSDTGKPGGKETGDAVSHYIEPGGRFARAIEQLLAGGFQITWRDVTANKLVSGDVAGSGPNVERGSLSGKRTKYACPHPGCKQTAWAKASAAFLCETHREKMVPAGRGPTSAQGGAEGPAPRILSD
jgi:SprT-like family protein